MYSKVTIVLLIQFGIPILAALSRELFRTKPRSGWWRLTLGVASVVLFIIPASVFAFVTGHSPHGESVDWYLVLCLFSAGIVPVAIALIVYLIGSTMLEPLAGFVRRKNVTDRKELASVA